VRMSDKNDKSDGLVVDHYLRQLQRFNTLALSEPTRRVFASFFESIQSSAKLYKPEDLILLDTVCDDFLWIKTLQKEVWEHGPIMKTEWMDKKGIVHERRTSNPAVEMLHRAETQFRNNLKALSLTRAEARKLSGKSDDPLKDIIAVDGEEVNEEVK